jgi:tRNA A-37 threonylcarbamoyl transferase component Bud32
MAAIAMKLERCFLWEEARGTLLWELEQGRPDLASIRTSIGEFVRALSGVRLVHGDLRPWNIFYEPETGKYSVIDWGFSCFMGEPKSIGATAHITERNPGISDEDLDALDLQKTIQALERPDKTEALWNHPPNMFRWRPTPWNT